MSKKSSLSTLELLVQREMEALDAQQREATEEAEAAFRRAQERHAQEVEEVQRAGVVPQEDNGAESAVKRHKGRRGEHPVAHEALPMRWAPIGPEYDADYLRLQGKAESLQKRAKHLKQVFKWIHEDPDLGQQIDEAIKRRVADAERRQRLYSVGVAIATSAVSLVVGWLLSALSPVATLAHLFAR